MDSRSLTKQQARLFILAHQGLLSHQRLEGKEGILSYVARVGCLQFDPLNVVGYNQQLVLQSRVAHYRPELLDELLYVDRALIDGWDKNMSIYRKEDWPYFTRFRNAAQQRLERMPEVHAIAPQVLERIREQGPLSSRELEFNEKVDWPWAPTRLSRAVLESMYFAGDLIVHHKDKTRKYYDLASRCLPSTYWEAEEPNLADEDYYEWYVRRRIGAIGLLWNKASDAWLGISGLTSKERSGAFERLLERGAIRGYQVEGIPIPLYARIEDVPLLNEIRAEGYNPPERAFVLAPLDNMLWDRKLIQQLFDFAYIWEVYKPAIERQFGYYVLPVMYGEQFIGRFEPSMDKKRGILTIKNWWWEPGVAVTPQLIEALERCFREFMGFTGAKIVEGLPACNGIE